MHFVIQTTDSYYSFLENSHHTICSFVYLSVLLNIFKKQTTHNNAVIRINLDVRLLQRRLYLFLIFYFNKELDEIKTYPMEVISGLLYLGNLTQGSAPYIQKDLKIKGHVKCCNEEEIVVSKKFFNYL